MFDYFVKFVVAVSVAQALSSACTNGACAEFNSEDRLKRAIKLVLHVDWKPIKVFEK